jgi:hypothetical protein
MIEAGLVLLIWSLLGISGAALYACHPLPHWSRYLFLVALGPITWIAGAWAVRRDYGC